MELDTAVDQTEQPAPTTYTSPKKSSQKVKTRNLTFLGAALGLIFVLFALVAGVMHRQPHNSHSEVKQKEYNEEFNSLTPSTSYVKMSEDDHEALDAVQVDELDSEFKTLDTAVENL